MIKWRMVVSPLGNDETVEFRFKGVFLCPVEFIPLFSFNVFTSNGSKYNASIEPNQRGEYDAQKEWFRPLGVDDDRTTEIYDQFTTAFKAYINLIGKNNESSNLQ